MTVGVADEGPEQYEPPRLAPDSPPAPAGRPRPLRGDRLFVDTGVIYGTDCRLPLLLLAGTGLLEVRWSPYVAAEVARVATREQAFETVRHDPPDLPRKLAADLERRRHEIDRVVSDHERLWGSPPHDVLREVSSALPPNVISDAKDIPILAGALACGATFLLSTNERHFPHGGSYESVVFWHPDTFLTTYFETDLEAYAFVAQELDAFAREAGAELRP